MSASEEEMFLETIGSFLHETICIACVSLCLVLGTNLFIHSLLGPHMYLKMKYSSQFCHFVIEPDKISVFFNSVEL